MYNEIIINRLKNLTYLSTLKNSNATAITKKNPYGDIVKFYAQINKNNVIQAISFKATGCSYFIALSSYFCEIVEGKTIDEALKIKEKDLMAFAELDESKHHIYPIILSTFALLIKKYRKGLEMGKITPCEVSKTTKVEVKKRATTQKSVDVREGLGEILVNDSKSATSSKRTTKITKTTVTETVTVEEKRERALAIKEAKKQAKIEKLEKKAQAKEEKRLAKEKAIANKSTTLEVSTQVAEAKVSNKAKAEKSTTVTAKATKNTTNKSETTVVTSARKTESATKTDTASKVTAKVTKAEPKKVEKKETAKDIVIVEEKKTAKPAKIESKKAATTKKATTKKESGVKTQALVKAESDVVVSDSIPENNVEPHQNQIIVEHVEHKRRVETIRRGGSTQTIEAERVDSLKLNAEGQNVHREVHSAANLNDMLSRLNASKTTKVNNVEVRSDMTAKKTVNGRVVDSKSASTNYSSMRDSLHSMRINNETKALPNAKKEEKKEEPQKKGLFARLFKK